MKEIKPIGYEDIVVKRVNGVYQNFKENAKQDFEIPKNILDFFDVKTSIQSRKDIEELGVAVTQSFSEWKPLDENYNKLIIINHLITILQCSVTVLLSIDKNLENEQLPLETIKTIQGVDIIISTSVQIFGANINELIKKFDTLELKNDDQKAFALIHKYITEIASLDVQSTFSNLVENIINFNSNYQNMYKKLATLQEDGWWTKRIELFMGYVNTYYLMVFLLELILIYPLQEKLMQETFLKNVLPNINLY